MKSDLIETKVLGDVDDVERLTADGTVGRAVLEHGKEVDGDVLVDLRRLRRLLLAFEDAHDSRYGWVSLRSTPEDIPLVTLQKAPEAADLMVLCGRTPTESYPSTDVRGVNDAD